MNRIAQISIALSVLFCTTSCNEKIDTDLLESRNYITVTSQVGPLVKAGYDESNLPDSFYMEIDDPDSQFDVSGTLVRSGSSNTYTFQGQNPVWGTHDANSVKIKAITAGGYDRAKGVMTVKTNQTTAANINASDLLGATTANGIVVQGNNINVSFAHLMSKLQVVYTSNVTVNSFKINNAVISGGYSFANMDYDKSKSLSRGSITMYHNTTDKVAEAIFFPNDASELPTLVANVTIGRNNIDLPCQISLKAGASFVGGKCYVMKVSISGSSIDNAEITVENWEKDESATSSGERVLWVGSSNAVGNPNNGYRSYPEAIDDALSCTIVNNSVNDLSVVSHLAQESGDYSYKSLILPYIDGTKDKCTTIVLDCGFGDRTSMVLEANGFLYYMQDTFQIEWLNEWFTNAKGEQEQYYRVIYNPVRGCKYLMALRDGGRTEGGRTYEQYLEDIQNPSSGLTGVGAYYIKSMCEMIGKIKSQYPNVRIIIGNYFTLQSPVVANQFAWTNTTAIGQGLWGDYRQLGNLICYYNEAVAGILDLDIVNVQNYMWITETEFWNYCSDGVHPWNPDAIQAIADIYIRELDGVVGSR